MGSVSIVLTCFFTLGVCCCVCGCVVELTTGSFCFMLCVAVVVCVDETEKLSGLKFGKPE